MTKMEISSRPELRAADDAVIEDAVAHADPMVLRGLIYQLTGDPEVAATGVKSIQAGFAENGYRIPDLLRLIATSDAFYAIAPAGGAQSASDPTPTGARS